MTGLVPPIGTRGLYSLKAPFVTQPNELYTCGAVRSFTDLENLGTDIYATYYAPFGLDQSVYTTDRSNSEMLISLLSPTYPPIYVPSSYILSYPNQQSKEYQIVVLSASLGPIPVDLDLTFALQQVAATLSDVIGVEPTVNIAVAPSTGSVTYDQYQALEAARQASVANRTTDRAKLLTVQAQLEQCQQQNAILTKIIKDHGLLS